MAADKGRVPTSRNKVRQRYQPPPGDWDPDIPYGGKVYLPRKKKDDSIYVRVAEVLETNSFYLYKISPPPIRFIDSLGQALGGPLALAIILLILAIWHYLS
jgi:hypothetical protein